MSTSKAYGTITISDLADGAQIWTTSNAPSSPDYTFTISNLTGDENADIKVGDLIFYDTYRYTVTSVGSTTVLASYRTDMQGERGTGIWKITTAPSTYSTQSGGFTPTYRIALSTVKTQSGAEEIITGDILEYSYYHYPVGYVDASYVYLGARVSFRGATGSAGTKNAFVYLYQRAASAPAVPSEDTVYTFAGNELTGSSIGNWKQDISQLSAGSDPVWMTAATASATGASDTITSSEWTAPIVVFENGAPGEDGYNQATVFLYKRSATPISAIDWSTALTYTFATGALDTVPSGWSRTVPDGDNPCYVTSAAAISQDTTCAIAAGSWAGVVKLVEDGVSVAGVTNYYLASSSSSGVTTSTAGWTTDPTAAAAVMTSTKQYLWNYEVITGSDGSTINTTSPAIIGRYGQNGGAGRGISSITEHYLATSASSGVTTSTSGWTTTVQSTTPTNKYLWNYETITYTSGTTTENTDPRIIGTYGVSVTNITSTNNTEDGGTSTITVTLSDGTTKTFTVKNGETGSTAEWYYGTALAHTSGTATLATSSTSGVVVGAMYLNPNTSLVYKCTNISGSTATWTYAGDITTGVLENLEVGGRNLSTLKNMILTDGVKTFTKNSGKTWFLPVGVYLLSDYGLSLVRSSTTNDIFSLSFDWTAENVDANATIRAIIKSSSNAYSSSEMTWINIEGNVLTAGETCSGHFKGRCKLNSSVINDYGDKWIFDINTATSNNSTKLYVSHFMFEKATIGSTWSLAPEDVESTITAVQTLAQAAKDSADGKVTTFYQSGTPTANAIGDLWIDTTDSKNSLKRWDGSSWVAVDNADLQTALTNAATAQATADGKIVTFAQASSPTATDVGDLWIDTSNGKNNLKRWNGSAWIAVDNADIQKAINDAADAQSTADTALSRSVEYIVGTQTAKTGSWTGVSTDIALTAGKVIAYKLPYAGSGNASLTLTMANGTNTAAIPVYLNTTRVTTHFGAGSVITMAYDGSAWRASSIPNTNNYDRRLHNNNILAVSAITASHLICGTSAGYKMLGANVSFDLSYPLLLASAAIAANASAATTYEAYPSVNFETTYGGAVEEGAAKKVLFLKGNVQGNTFTIASTNWLTTVVPDTAPGDGETPSYYIPLGVMSSTTSGYFSSSNRLYAFLYGAFQAVDTAAQQQAADAADSATTANETADKTKQAFDEFKETDIKRMTEDISALNENKASNEALDALSTLITTNANNISNNLTALNNYKEYIRGYLRIDEENGIIDLGKQVSTQQAEHDFHLRLEGNQLVFYDGDTAMAYFHNTQLYAPDSIFKKRAKIGKFAFINRSSGNLSFMYVGGNE